MLIKNLFQRHNIKAQGALHVGAHIGHEAAFYNQAGISKMIFIEAIPEIFLELKANLSQYPHAVALNACIGEEDGVEKTFHISSNEGQSSSLLEFGTHSAEHPSVTFVRDIKVKTTRLDTLFDEISLKGFDFLNMDLQGCELMALKSLGVLLNQFKWVYLEVNEKELYKGCALLPEVDQYMAQFSFVRVETKMTDHGWGDALYVKSN